LRATLVLTLRDEAGKPVPTANIEVTRNITAFGFGFSRAAKQSDTGTYRLADLETGEWMLIVRPGEKQGLEFRNHYLETREKVAFDSGKETASPSRIEPALEPGEHEFELSADGRETKRVSATVKAGETTDVKVTLRKL